MILGFRRSSSAAIACLILLSALGCDRLYEPVAYNSLDEEVEVHVSWEDGRSESATIPAKGVVHLGRRNLALTELRVYRGGEEIAVLDESRLDELVAKADKSAVGIAISENGVQSLTQEELNSVRE